MHPLRLIVGVFVLGLAALATLELVMAAGGSQPSGRQLAQAQKKEEKPKTPRSRPIDQDLRHFMRVKLEASGKILEGLAVEDYALVKEGATKLHEMSTAEKWRVTNDALYRNFSDEFQRVTRELVEAAGEENLDRAALKWMDATMSCIECHRYVRGIFIADAGSAPEVQP